MFRRFSRALPVIALALVLPLAACKKGDNAARSDNAPLTPNPNGPADTGAPASEKAPGTVHVTDVSLGKALDADKKVQNPTDTFSPKDTIFASVTTDGAGKAATLYAKWTFQDGQVIRNDQRTISPNGPAVTEFSVQKADGWPKGGYKLDVSIDSGGAASTKSFRVQ